MNKEQIIKEEVKKMSDSLFGRSEICLQDCHPNDKMDLLKKIESSLSKIYEEGRKKGASDLVEIFRFG